MNDRFTLHVVDLAPDPKVAAANAEFDIMSVLAQAWPSLAKKTQEDVIQILSPKSLHPNISGARCTC